MIGKRRLRVAYLLGSLLALAASLHAPTAYAAPGDPPTGSPAGGVYQLPLEQGRADGAPKGGSGTAGGGGGGSATGGGGQGEPGSLYRSENNFGSSSHVPGVAAGGGGSGGGPTSGGSGAASGGGGAAPGGGAAAGGAAIGANAAGNGNTSVPGSIVLLAAIALLAAAVGVLSRRLARGRAEPSH